MYIYNLKRCEADDRDLKFDDHATRHTRDLILPDKIDLTGSIPLPVLNQGNLGSCTANASSNALRYCLEKQKSIVFQPSRLFIYYFTRFIEGNIQVDSGANIRDVMKAIHCFGACNETKWPYIIDKFRTRPSSSSIQAAKPHAVTFQYLSITHNLDSIKNVLASGYPIVFGIAVYESLERQECITTGIVPIPDMNTERCMGGHCILMTGYDDTTQMFTILNSWGKSVGQMGYFQIPYAYIANPNLTFDLWTIDFF